MTLSEIYQSFGHLAGRSGAVLSVVGQQGSQLREQFDGHDLFQQQQVKTVSHGADWRMADQQFVSRGSQRVDIGAMGQAIDAWQKTRNEKALGAT